MARIVTLADLVAKPFDLVKAKWAMMLAFIKQRDVVICDPAAKVSVDATGTRVAFRARGGRVTPLRVSVSGRRVSVLPGYVDDRMPTIGGIALDGRDKEGHPGRRPAEFLAELPEDAGPGPEGRSYLCVKMAYLPEERVPDTSEEDWLTIDHVPDLAAARKEGAAALAYEPLAVLYWREDRIESAGQITTLNLKHIFVPGDPGRHFFAGV